MLNVNGGKRHPNALLREREVFILQRLLLLLIYFPDLYDDYIALCRDAAHQLPEESMEQLKELHWVNREGKAYPTVKDVVVVILRKN